MIKDCCPLEQEGAVEIIQSPHCTDEETKAQRGPVTCPPSHSQSEAKQKVDSLFSAQDDLTHLKGFPSMMLGFANSLFGWQGSGGER